MRDPDCVAFLQWALPQLQLRWAGFRKVRKQVCKRLGRRLVTLGLPDLTTYRDYLADEPGEWDELDRLCRISISRFYRDRGVFDQIGQQLLPSLGGLTQQQGRRQIDAWCIGCCGGEEVYSLQIIWQHQTSRLFAGIDLHILATDADPLQLERARIASYTAGSLKDLPEPLLRSCFDEVDEVWTGRQPYRANVIFRQQDIRRHKPDGPFDLILCRNLMFTYFAPWLQKSLARAICERLRPGGFLVIGKGETLPEDQDDLGVREQAPHTRIYRKEKSPDWQYE